MVIQSFRVYLSLFFFLALVSLSCQERREVVITKSYVINPYWDKTANAFRVIKMNSIDSSRRVSLANCSTSDLVKKLEKDTSFAYTGNVRYNGQSYSVRKVYFGRDNGFLWWGNLYKPNSTKTILGELQYETWYLLAGLGKPKTLYYIYLDSLDSLYTFEVPASAWTNY